MRTDDAQEVKSRIAQAISSIPGIPPEMVASVNALARHNPAAALKIIASERKNAAGEGKFTTEVINGIKYQRGPKGKLELFPTAKDDRTTAQKNLEAQGLKPGTPAFRDAMKAFMAKKGGVNVDVKVDTGKMPLGKKSINIVEADLMNASDSYRRLSEIKDTFDSKFMTYVSKAKSWLLAFAEKVDPGLLSDEDKRFLGDESIFKRKAYEALNLYIKQITGAQMSEAEAKRLTKAFVNAAGDSPTQFVSKLNDLIRTTRESVARLAYLKEKGIAVDPDTFKGRGIPQIYDGLKDKDGNVIKSPMQRIMDRRYLENYDKIRKLEPKATDDEVGRKATRRTAGQFGLVAR